MDEIESRLEHFALQKKFKGKGPLSVALMITREAMGKAFPLTPEGFITAQGGQVRGLGKSSVQKVLSDHNINRVLAAEAGRTSRGSINRMRSYLEFLNQLYAAGMLDLDVIEHWWIGRVKAYFATKPLKVRADQSKSLGAILGEVLEAAYARQRECPGTMVAGAVMQHLVGAKLEITFPDIEITHSGFSVADAPTGRRGDFTISDTVIHVTAAPTEALILKCIDNLHANFRPLIITTNIGAGGAIALAKAKDVGDRIEVLDIIQFITTNICEWMNFSQEKRSLQVSTLVNVYNRLIDRCESDPSLKLDIA